MAARKKTETKASGAFGYDPGLRVEDALAVRSPHAKRDRVEGVVVEPVLPVVTLESKHDDREEALVLKYDVLFGDEVP